MKKVWFFLLVCILCIEVGMRAAIWRALDEVVPENATYSLNVVLLDSSLFYPCTAYDNDENSYMNVFYTFWLTSIIYSHMVCEYQSYYITLMVDPPNLNIKQYYWSFHHMGFDRYYWGGVPK